MILEATTTTVGVELRVRGTLRDETGRPVPHRAVTVTGRPDGADDPERAFHVEAVVDSDGRFVVARRVSPGTWSVAVRFAGDLYLDAATTTLEVAVRPARAHVVLDVPRVVDATTRAVPLIVRVTVAGEPASGVVVGAFADCGAVAPLAPTGDDGATAADLTVIDLESPTCGVAVSARGEGRFADVEDHVVVRRVTEPEVAVEATHHGGGPFGGGEWELVVAVRDRLGPIAGAPIDLVVAGTALRAESDDDGIARFEAPADPRGAPTTATASLLGHPGPILAEQTMMLEAPPPAASVFGRVAAWLAGALALGLLAALVREIRPGLPARPQRAPRARPVETERVDEPAPTDGPRVWTVHVRDADTDDAVSAAVIGPNGEHATDHGGVVVLPYDRAVDLEVRASGYLPLRATVSPPRRSRRTVLRLRSVRAEVRDILRLVVAELGAVPDAASWWGMRTIEDVRGASSRGTWRLRREPPRDAIRRREIARLVAAMGEGTGTEADAFDALAFLVDAVYFGGAGDPDHVIGLARELADVAGGGRDA